MELEEREKAEKKKRGPKSGSVSPTALTFHKASYVFIIAIKLAQGQNNLVCCFFGTIKKMSYGVFQIKFPDFN